METTSTTYEPLIDAGIRLAELAVKGTVSAVNKKIRAIKDERNTEKIRATYDELINEVLQEREEAVRIAQMYKSELDRIQISDDDIEHLHNTVERVLDIVKLFQIAAATEKGPEEVEKVSKQVESYQQISELISVDTLKTMQMLGFNYKAAIGEPLTKKCAEAIEGWGNKAGNKVTNNKHK